MTIPPQTPVEFVDQALAQVIAAGASDLFWIPERGRMVVAAKINGQRQAIAELPTAYGEQCVTRLKVLAGLLTYRTQQAQDGAIRPAPNTEQRAELRVATLPTSHGERVTVRILDPARVPLHLEELGYQPETHAALLELLRNPYGMLVLTGPTGSGKTTTIYALLRELLRQGAAPASIITIEDPIEQELPGVSQVQVTRGGEEWGYAQALRAALRHDVKTLVIGELRDAEVARVALDAALTGHRVITTFHAGDSAAVYARLLHQGFEPFLVAAAVSGVVAQRLALRADGSGCLPVAAVLHATDAWRETVVANPGLGELRKQLALIPGATLAPLLRTLVERGVIHPKEELVS